MTSDPSLLVSLKYTVGALPGAALVTSVISMSRPASCFDFVGIVCAPMIEMSNSTPLSGTWQAEHRLSSNCGTGWPSPVSHTMSSWHEPQAARLGSVYQTYPCGVSSVWQRTQLRMSCGNRVSE